MKKMLCLLCTALAALNTGCSSPGSAPDLCREPPAADFTQMFGALDALPEAWDDGTRDLRTSPGSWTHSSFRTLTAKHFGRTLCRTGSTLLL